MAKQKAAQMQPPRKDTPAVPVGEAMTEDAAEWMQRLTTMNAKALAVLDPADVVNAMMGATVSLSLGFMPHKDLSKWLRRIANEVDAECAGRKLS